MEKEKGLKTEEVPSGEDGVKPPAPSGHVGCTQLVDIKPPSGPPKLWGLTYSKGHDARLRRAGVGEVKP